MTTTTTTSTTDVAPLQSDGTQTLVSVVAGGHELVMKTDHLVGVYQLSREQLESADLGSIQTPQGELSVVALSKVVDDCLGLKPQGDTTTERALVTIEFDGKVSMLKAQQVSRPMYIPNAHFHELPHIAHPNDTGNLVKYLANIDPESTDPNKALRMLFDPLAALGLGNSEEILGTGSGDMVGRSFRSGVGVDGFSKSNRNQLLAFVPEDFARDSLDFVFCLPLSAVAEVVKSQQIFEMPINSPLFAGYILWREIPVPVVRLGAAFGSSVSDNGESNSGRRVVIARLAGNRYVAFNTQAQMQSMKVPTSIPHPIDDSLPCIGAFKTEFSTLVIPDLAQILDGGK